MYKLILFILLLACASEGKAQTPNASTSGLTFIGVTPSGTVALIDDTLVESIFCGPGVASSGSTPEPSLGCHCFGKVMADCYSFGPIGGEYSLGCNTGTHHDDCCSRVKNAAASLTAAQKLIIQNCLCGKNLADGTTISVSAGIGTQDYVPCEGKIGTIHQTPAYDVTICKCPSGWLASQTNIDGGVTNDLYSGCKRKSCSPLDPGTCKPPDGTQLGTWGFAWGNAMWEYGTECNGGKAICTTVHHPKGPCTITWGQ